MSRHGSLYGANGAAPSAVYAGSTPASAVYLGDLLVWPPRAAHAPELTKFDKAGTFTYTIPDWCDVVDIVCLSGGMAGYNGTLGNGSGGNAGLWTSLKLDSTKLPLSTRTLNIVVGAGGAANGAKGSASTVTGAGVAAITATPNTATNILDTVGKSPGNHTFNGQTYIGGAAQKALNQPGNAPGGGGAAGGFMSNGGKGADGAVWVYAYQV